MATLIEKIKKIRLVIHKMHLYTRKGEGIAKTMIFWVSWIFGLKGINDSSDSTAIGSGFLMFALAMIMEYAISAMERKSFTKILPSTLAIINGVITVISASYFVTTPIELPFIDLMGLTQISLIIISIDSILLFIEDAEGLENKAPPVENPDEPEKRRIKSPMIITISCIAGVVLAVSLKSLEIIEKRLQKKEYSKAVNSVSSSNKDDVHSNVDFNIIPHEKRMNRKWNPLRYESFRCILPIIMVLIIFLINFFNLKRDENNRYEYAISKMDSGDYLEALSSFEELGNFKDSLVQIETAQNWIAYQSAQELFNERKFKEAADSFSKLGSFENSESLLQEATYQYAIQQYELGNYEESALIFQTLGDYCQSKLYDAQIALILYESKQQTVYEEACRLYSMELYTSALEEFEN